MVKIEALHGLFLKKKNMKNHKWFNMKFVSAIQCLLIMKRQT
jgi:hypothetical protein